MVRKFIPMVAVFALIALLLCGLPAQRAEASPGWWNSDWQYRQKLTFDNSGQSENLVNFPVLVKLTEPTNIDYSKTQDNGEDIRFVDSNDVTELSYEIEEWDETGDSWVWVKVPQIDGSSNTDYIYMYYGNSGASDGQNATAVWDSNFMMVQHMSEDPSGTVPQMKDSTSHGNNGTSYGSMTSSDLVDAKIGKGLDLDGVDGAGGDYISVADSTSLDGTVDEGTWSMWINWDNWGAEQVVIMAIADRFTIPTDGYEWGAQLGSPDGNLFAYPWARDLNYNLNTGTDFTNGTWHYISVRYDWTSRTLTLNLDGNDLTNNINGVNITNWTQQATIDAAWLWGGSPERNTRFIDAQIDEIRVSDIVRSADWIAAQYLSMTDNLITFGGEEERPLVGGEVYPINKAAVLMPWLGLAFILILAIGGGALALRKRRTR